MTRVLVVGGGLSGLACAHALVLAGLEVAVLEASERVGGLVGTREVDGFRFELGPGAVPADAPALRALCGELGIADRLIASEPGARRRSVHVRGKLHPLPATVPETLATPLLPLGARLRLAAAGLRRSARADGAGPEPTLAALLEERLGPWPARLFAAALVRCALAGDVDRLGARSALPCLGVPAGGILRATRERQLSFPDGMQELVDALEAALGERVRRSAPVRALGPAPGAASGAGGRWSVELAGGSETADHVVLAVPAPAAAQLCASLPAPPAAAGSLAAIEGVAVTAAHLGYGPEAEPAFADAGGFPSGSGYVVPPGERGHGVPGVLGTIFASNLFPGRAPAGGLAVSSFYAGEKLEGMEPHSIVRTAEKDLARALRLGELPRSRASLVCAWDRPVPQYAVGHAERMAAAEAELGESLPGLHLAGDFVGGIGPEQAVARGRRVAARVRAAEGGR